MFQNRIDQYESEKLMTELGINATVINKCVDDSFGGGNKAINENYVLKSAQEDWEALGAKLYPQLVINGRTFKGRLSPDNAFEAICAAF